MKEVACRNNVSKLAMKQEKKIFWNIFRHSKEYDLSKDGFSRNRNDLNNENGIVKATACLGHRHIVVILGFVLCALVNSHRMVVGVTIVAMVNHTMTTENGKNKSQFSCPLREEYRNSSETLLKGDLDWDSELQGYIHGAGYLGLIITQIPSGRMAEVWGAKWVLFFGNSISALCTLFSPFAARWSVYLMIALQFVRALSQGVVIPSVYVMMANWFPRNERGYLSTFLFSGYPIGAVTAGLISGWLCDIPGLEWPSAYYFYGMFGGVFSIVFIFTFYEVPEEHPRITQAELKYITEHQESDMTIKRASTPWLKIFTSLPVYALFAGMYGFRWSTIYFMTVHPTYMGTVLHYSMTDNGIVSSLPILLKALGGFVATFATNILTNKMHPSKLRKSCNSIGVFGFSLAILGVCFSGCDGLLNVMFFSLSCFCTGFSLSGAMIIALDMTPRFAGSLMGIVTAFADTAPVILHLMVGELTGNESIDEWQRVFHVSIGVVLSCGIVFIIFGTADVQPWNFASEVKSEVPKSDSKQVEKNGKLSELYDSNFQNDSMEHYL